MNLTRHPLTCFKAHIRMNSIVKMYLGRLLNLLGFPAFVREGEYRSEGLGAKIKVLRMDLSTLVSVNGFDVYFNRFTGAIEGVGFSPAAYCTSGRTAQSEHPDVPRDTPALPVHTQRIAG
jgi:hypothetical protein